MMSRASLFSIALCFLLLSHGSLAQLEYGQGRQQQDPYRQGRQSRSQSQCRIESLNALEPRERVESEAGVTEFWDQNDQQFECAGVAAMRHTLQPRGLLLPEFSNAHKLVYIAQGSGITGVVLPGCPETFQSFQQSQRFEEDRGQQSSRDQHQRIRRFRQGDILALPAGVAHWCYNDGDTPVVAISVIDTSNQANQLDRNLRKFMLAGNLPRGGGQQEHDYGRHGGSSSSSRSSGSNILSGFDTELLAEAFGISTETARKIQGENDRRGFIVRVEHDLHVVKPRRGQEEEEIRTREEEEREREERGSTRYGNNGLDEAICNTRLKENIGDPIRADIFSQQGGHLTTLNSQKLPILRYLQLNAVRGHLRRNAILAPHWNTNAHSIVYAIRGSARIQIVGNSKRPVFDGELRRGQIVIVPQNFAVVKQAGNEEFEWVSFKTNDLAIKSQLVGKASAIGALPEEVIMNSYRISREEARSLKNNRRDESLIFAPRSQERRAAE